MDTAPSSHGTSRLARGASVGRFVILDELGSGGMGVVYAAYDPELERKVALKLVKADAVGSSPVEARSRLMREAQIMARANHPNVVSVFDVGAFGDGVFVAMELVEGVTLERWLPSHRRSWREVLEALTHAGRGLAAAHAAGLVHRDFKPANVLIGPGSRVRVTDFGLARATSAPPTEPGPRAIEPAQLTSSSDTLLSRATEQAGTPPYMAPEQHQGEPAGPLSDQFSFCVTLYEALHGARPFAGDGPEALAKAMREGRVAPPPEGSRVPAWLQRVVLRGLSAEPPARYPSMDALLDALTATPRRRRRIGWWSAAAVAVLAALAAVAALRPYRAGLCEGAERKLAGLWDGPRRGALSAAFSNLHSPFAQESWQRAEPLLASYAEGWVAMHTEACVATRVRGEQSDEVLTLRMICLSRRLDELRALVGLLAEPGLETARNAVSSVKSLTPLSACADVAALKAEVPPPNDPAARAQVDELRSRLVGAKALLDTGRYREGMELAAKLAAEARALRYAPLTAEGLVLLADLQDRAGETPTSEQTLYDALQAGNAGHADRLVARAWISLVQVVGNRLRRGDAAWHWSRAAEAALARIGGDQELEASLTEARGNLYRSDGKYDQSLAEHARALALREKVYGPEHLAVAETLTSMAGTYLRLDRYDEAMSAHRRAFAIRTKLLGPRHPDVAQSLSLMGAVLWRQLRYDDALQHLQRGLEIRSEALGPEHPDVASSATNMGTALSEQGRHEEAEKLFRRALAIREKTLGPDDLEVALNLFNLGTSLYFQGRVADSREYLDRALAIREKALGPEHVQTVHSLVFVALVRGTLGEGRQALRDMRHALTVQEAAFGQNHTHVGDTHEAMARVLLVMGKPREALAELQKEVAILERTLGPSSPTLWMPLALSGRAEIALGSPKKAVPPLERALELREHHVGDIAELADIHFDLAQALWAAGKDRRRARSLAEKAREEYAQVGGRGARQLVAVGAWLARHRAER